VKTLPRRAATASLVALLALLALAPAAPAQRDDDDPPRATVMSRNLFLGVDIRRAAGPQTQPEFDALVLQLFREVQATDPAGRMALVAEEIEDTDPELVGLQEVTVWQVGSQEIDYLDLLRSQLKRRRLSYRVVGVQPEVDARIQTSQGPGRFYIGNAILVKKGVRTSRVRTGAFNSQISFPTAAGTFPVTRGWDSLKATVEGARFTFVNTHLEAFSPPQRDDQARELVAGPLKARGGIILVGDLNSNANAAQPVDRPAFNTIRRAGFVVRQTRRQTCCLRDDLKTGVRDHTVDFVMSKPRLPLLRSGLTGTRERTSAGTQAADHAGVWATLELEE
jgi:endonuclease/exonuclease/phosphatase family metal-dependent hydrolase